MSAEERGEPMAYPGGNLSTSLLVYWNVILQFANL